ncbi:MAG: 4Fe-4S binding protein [Bacillota bacterium]
MLSKTGVPTKEQIEAIKPSKERLAKGAVAIVECFQEIPCDPCYTSCKSGCILPFANINDLPQMNFENCTGCGVCIGACPGLAIFVVDETYSDTEALLMIPWEFAPVPEEGSVVTGLSREGKEVGPVTVKKVRSSAQKNGAYILSLEVPKDLAFEIRSISLKETSSKD